MAFQELLDQVGGLGKFHILQIVLVFPYLLLLLSHFLLENFTAAIPSHRCWVNILDNDTVTDNDTGILSPDALLRISIPLDSESRPEKCQRFIRPQWHLLHLNGTFTNRTEPDTEACLDGWVYDQSSFLSTMVSEWDLVRSYQSWRSVAQFLFMAGMLVGGFIYGHLSDRFGRKVVLRCVYYSFPSSGRVPRLLPPPSSSASFASCQVVLPSPSWSPALFSVILGGLAFALREWRILQLAVSVPYFVFFLSSRWVVESARWLIINNKPDEGLKELRKVAQRNGRKNAGETLTIEALRSATKEELETAQTQTTVCDMFRTPSLRKIICILLFVRSAIAIPFYGIILNLHHFGNNIFLFQVAFGALTTVARCLPVLVMNYMGHRTTQTLFLVLTGLSILINTFVPQDMQILRVVLASVGISSAAASFTCFGIYFCEIIPTVLRARILGFDTLASRVGTTLATLLMILQAYLSTLPWMIYGVFPITSGLAVLFLPETKGLPLLDTINNLKNIKEISRKVNEINSHIKVTKV